MVQRLAGGFTGERVLVPFIGRDEVGRVGFHEDAVGRERAEEFALRSFAGVQEVERKGKVRAAFEQE